MDDILAGGHCLGLGFRGFKVLPGAWAHDLGIWRFPKIRCIYIF